MSKRLLLINPPVYDFAAFDLFAKPLGILYLAAWLRSAGFQVSLIDCMDRFHPAMVDLPREKTRPNNTGKYFAQKIDKPTPIKHIPRYYYRFGMPDDIFQDLLAKHAAEGIDAVLVTSIMTYWYPGVRDAIATVRKHMPATPILLGGVYATLMQEHAAKICQPDVVVPGTDHLQVLNILEDKLNIAITDRPSPDFADWPAPAFDLYHSLNYFSILTSLGCCNRCDYCAGTILQPTFQQCSPETALEHIAHITKLMDSRERYDLAFQDDALLVNAEKRFIPIVEGVIKTGLPYKLHSPNGLHCRLITPEIAALMKRGGFEMIRLSYEASDTSPEYQKASDNKVSDLHFQNAVRNLMSAGYKASQIEAYILNGLPGQRLEQMQASAQAVNQAGVMARLCQYTPIPHTPMFGESCRLMDIPADEPLLHNNTIMSARASNISDDDFQKFKNEVHRRNMLLTAS